MKKRTVLAILLFGAVWGILEAVLGGALYSRDVPQASVVLTTCGFLVLAVSRSFVSWTGAATLIAICSMLYKALNVPFFGCHLTGIALLGVGWDLAWGAAKIRRPALAAVLAVYLGHLLFVIAMVALFRSEHWIEKGVRGWASHVGWTGTLTAILCALVVPLGLRLGERLRVAPAGRSALLGRFQPVGLLVVTLGLWLYAVGAGLH